MYLFYFCFWEGISLKISQGTKKNPLILAQEHRWEIINNMLEPEERKISIPHDHTLQIVRNPLPINPFTLLFYLKPKKVLARLSSGASPPMSSQVSSHVNLLLSVNFNFADLVQVHKHY